MGSVGILLERVRELDILRHGLARTVDDTGAVVVLRGAAGLGKTALLSVGAEEARTQGMTVLSARASSLESHIPFGLARKLIAPLLRDAVARDRLLSGDGALATPLFSAAWAPGAGSDVAIGVQEGLCAIVANATFPAGDGESAPLTLILDDLQWADQPSLRFLLALLRRLDDIPVAVLCARRPEPDCASAALLYMMEDDPATVVRTLLQLSDPEQNHLVA
jgi:predicted ATPase